MVDALLLVDLDERSVTAATSGLSASGRAAHVGPFVVDVTNGDGVDRLPASVAELGTLRAVAHAAGISPTMADWRRVFAVDLVGTALLAEAVRPLATAGTATVLFALMAPVLGIPEPIPAADAALDAPLDESFLDRIHDALGPVVEDTGFAYAWAKRGVQRLAQREAVRLGPVGARVCSVSPGIVDTPQGRQEAKAHPYIDVLVQQTPLGRVGRAEEVAAIVAFLLSGEAGFITGVDVLVDGGACAALRGPAA
jgi:NAD(P)-dependent dehydrogenase (short-subunit alcohol dehydrogenase family)